MLRNKKSRFAVLLSMALCASILVNTGAVFATNDATQDKVQSLISRLEEADGGFPIDFSLEDMNSFLELADPVIVSEIMGNISDNAVPIPLPEASSEEKISDKRSDEYFEYDPFTKIEQKFEFDDSDPNTLPKVSKGEVVGNEIASPETLAYPDYWFEESPQSYYDTKSNVKVLTKFKNSSRAASGSGFLVSNDTLVTAAHSVYDLDSEMNGWCDYLVVYPSSSDNDNEPYGTATSNRIVRGDYSSTEYRGDDWAMTKLSRSFHIGYLGMETNTSSEKGREFRVQGYPVYLDSSGNPVNYATKYRNNNLFLSTGKIVRDGSAYLKYGDTTTYGGTSGGPVMYKTSDGLWVAGGIHSGIDNRTQDNIFCTFDNNLYNKIMNFAFS